MAHYYSQKQDSSLRIYTVRVKLKSREFSLASASGIFSCRALDRGTQVLIENCRMQPGWDVLDLGCGYGAVGISVAKMYRLGRLVMCDINERAVKTARINAKAEHVEAEVLATDSFSRVTGQFDTILLNPPQSAGKDLCIRMITDAKEFLKTGGLLQIVARHNKGGKVLAEKMMELYGNVQDIARKSGYRVYVCQKL
jgi:16S rRNA (guanine1207-N2)-methyltransferase